MGYDSLRAHDGRDGDRVRRHHAFKLILYVFFFFFQAEDGIRDKLVTGVQTCALPISVRLAMVRSVMPWPIKLRAASSPASPAPITSVRCSLKSWKIFFASSTAA